MGDGHGTMLLLLHGTAEACGQEGGGPHPQQV